jgi:uncharacterized repeat protein (TIGR01451 family)
MLMSYAGDGDGIVNVILTFDDSAAASLPYSSQIVSGTYKPTSFSSDTFTSPAPSGPYGQTLSVFNGSNPNGTWSLYAEDFANGDSGSLTQGWSLMVVTSNAVCCASTADLALGQSTSPTPLNLGTAVTYTLNVTNLGPNTAASVTVTDALPAGVSYVSATATQGACTNNGSTVSCALGALPNGATATITIYATATAAGSWTNTATVSSATPDPAANNNSASASISVNSPPVISSIANVITNENTVAGPVPFTIGDAETPAFALTLAGASSNTNLAPVANIVFGGSGSNRTVTVTPLTNQFGTATITVTVSDGLASASNSFVLKIYQVNLPPVLAAIADRTVHAGSTLVITNSATDPDSPPQVLTFSLTNSPPAGTAINPASGVFNWTSGDAYVDTTNNVTVVVSDNGVPPLSDAKSFLVTVVSRPLIESVTVSNDIVTMTWSAIAGQTYQVLFNDDLSSTNWTNLGGPVTATNATAIASDPISSDSQRFYRVTLVP